MLAHLVHSPVPQGDLPGRERPRPRVRGPRRAAHRLPHRLGQPADVARRREAHDRRSGPTSSCLPWWQVYWAPSFSYIARRLRRARHPGRLPVPQRHRARGGRVEARAHPPRALAGQRPRRADATSTPSTCSSCCPTPSRCCTCTPPTTSSPTPARHAHARARPRAALLRLRAPVQGPRPAHRSARRCSPPTSTCASPSPASSGTAPRRPRARIDELGLDREGRDRRAATSPRTRSPSTSLARTPLVLPYRSATGSGVRRDRAPLREAGHRHARGRAARRGRGRRDRLRGRAGVARGARARHRGACRARPRRHGRRGPPVQGREAHVDAASPTRASKREVIAVS